MLCEHDNQIDAKDCSGQPSVWRDVYRKMGCLGLSCQNEVLDAHDDIPDDLRNQLDAEERQQLSKQKFLNNVSTVSMRPPTNFNVLPTQSGQPLKSSSWGADATLRTIQPDYVDIPGYREAVVEEYANWHLSRVSSENYKENIKQARDIALDNRFDIGNISRLDPKLFVEQGVKIGVARRFVSDTELWRDERDSGSA
ncbi:hypothetical protein EYZ11_012653 [Aspergillus tanneri]|uniref:Uncharacterized protein n=1 Tax=Aspergillus tanneri TaxID=1220188 RepID=A0A4S3J080_9EURO|nr:uncharacterized protein ATNIH1004_011652 [Aspergillus tanneri]KAA8641516.1 hypothetical protein ATNIH1004_011652 [Aspergillus tanneri]THC87902.1 hypothetical protein EYZ11_012653 [Aspergillus tanneri]